MSHINKIFNHNKERNKLRSSLTHSQIYKGENRYEIARLLKSDKKIAMIKLLRADCKPTMHLKEAKECIEFYMEHPQYWEKDNNTVLKVKTVLQQVVESLVEQYGVTEVLLTVAKHVKD